MPGPILLVTLAAATLFIIWSTARLTAIGEDMGYGPARYLTPEQVKETAEALRLLDDQELRRKYNPEAFAAADIYPEIWVRDGDEALAYVMEYLAQVRAFFLAAAQAGQAMVLYLC